MGLRSIIAALTTRASGVEPREVKSSGGGSGSLVFTGALGEGGTGREPSYEALGRTGFMQNPVVHRSVRLIAETAAAVPLLLYEGSAEVAEHPMLDLPPLGSSCHQPAEVPSSKLGLHRWQ